MAVVVVRLQRLGVDVPQFMADVQSAGIGLALVRAALEIGTKLSGLGEVGMKNWLQHRQLPA